MYFLFWSSIQKMFSSLCFLLFFCAFSEQLLLTFAPPTSLSMKEADWLRSRKHSLLEVWQEWVRFRVRNVSDPAAVQSEASETFRVIERINQVLLLWWLLNHLSWQRRVTLCASCFLLIVAELQDRCSAGLKREVGGGGALRWGSAVALDCGFLSSSSLSSSSALSPSKRRDF